MVTQPLLERKGNELRIIVAVETVRCAPRPKITIPNLDDLV